MQGRMILTSGRKLDFTHVQLFNALHISHLQRMLHSAESKLQGFASPYGAIGSFRFVTTVLLANWLVESAVNRHLSDEATKLLEEYQQLLSDIRQSGRLIAVDVIEEIKIPMPSVWHSTLEKKIHDPSGNKTIRVPYVHNGDPYVVIGTAKAEVAVIWDKVEQYEVA